MSIISENNAPQKNHAESAESAGIAANALRNRTVDALLKVREEIEASRLKCESAHKITRDLQTLAADILFAKENHDSLLSAAALCIRLAVETEEAE